MPDWNRRFPKRHRESCHLISNPTSPNRALPDALRTLLIQQTEALEALLQYTQNAMDTIRANGSLSTPEQTAHVDALAQEVSERLIDLADKKVQMQTHLEEFQRLLRQQGNSILAYTVDRVTEVLQTNIAKAKEQIHAMVSRRE